MDVREKRIYVEILQREFHLRKRNNLRYSLRAFARSLAINSASLSAIFQGNRELPLNMGLETTRRLSLNEQDKLSFLQSLTLQHTSLHSLATDSFSLKAKTSFRPAAQNHNLQHNSCAINIDSQRLPEAKKLFDEFLQRLSYKLNSDDKIGSTSIRIQFE